ncbi:MAG: DUF2341 domain-containing protein [Candidatus Omnitrophota bacterium]|nr:MAG: DUF2341 domain-containing protein [Candidatus Omnitrophota bacterium]
MKMRKFIKTLVRLIEAKPRSLIIFLVACAVGVGYITAVYADPDTVIFKSPLVWRTDGKGDYLLPKDLQGKYLCREIIVTEGKVESITVNWKSEGSVNLEVSADDGDNYASVVNGLPLTGGFISGERIRWKAYIGAESKLHEVKISYTDSAGTVGSFGAPYLSECKYRKKIEISNTSASLVNYQMKLAMGESAVVEEADFHCQGEIGADFRDVRFTAADGQTLLPHYIEEVTGRRPRRLAKVWVKIPHIPAGGISIYVYYGNRDAEDLSNPDQVFDFCDEFKGASLDSEKWATQLDSQGKLSLSSSGLLISDAQVSSKDYAFGGGVIEYSAMVKGGKEAALIIRGKKYTSSVEEDVDQLVYSSVYKGAEHCIAVGGYVKTNDSKPIVENTVYDYRVIAEANKIIFERYSQGFKERQAQTIYKGTTADLQKGYVGLKVKSINEEDSRVLYRWIRVRKYASAAPQVSRGNNPQEEVKLAEFTNTTIKENGNIVLLQGTKDGSYQSAPVKTPFMTRMMNISYELPLNPQEVLRADVSADAGKTFKINCEQAVRYYASKKDFSAGDTLVCRLHFKKEKPQLEVKSIKLEYAPGDIVLLSPNGGEILLAGQTYEIKWSAVEYDYSYPMTLQYSLDSGQTYSVIAEDIENNGSYLWTVPAVASDTAVLRISDGYDASIFDDSDAAFVIKGEAVVSFLDIVPKAEPLKEKVKALPAEEEELVPQELEEEKEEVVEVREEVPEEEIVPLIFGLGFGVTVYNAQTHPQDFYLKDETGKFTPYIFKEVSDDRYEVFMRSKKGIQKYVFTSKGVSLWADEGEGFGEEVRNFKVYVQGKWGIFFWEDLEEEPAELSYEENDDGTVTVYQESSMGTLVAKLGFDGVKYYNKFSFKTDTAQLGYSQARVYWDTVLADESAIKRDASDVKHRVRKKVKRFFFGEREEVVTESVSNEVFGDVIVDWKDFKESKLSEKEKETRAQRLEARSRNNPHRADTSRVWFYEGGKRGEIEIDPTLTNPTPSAVMSIETGGRGSSDFKLVFKEVDGGISEFRKGTGASWSGNFGSATELITELDQGAEVQVNQASYLKLLEASPSRIKIENKFSLGAEADVYEEWTVYPTGKIVKCIKYEKLLEGTETRKVDDAFTDYIASGMYGYYGETPETTRDHETTYYDNQILKIIGVDTGEITDYQSPSVPTVTTGTLETAMLGDADNDGFNESEGAYEIRSGLDNKFVFSLDGTIQTTYKPVFKIHDVYPISPAGSHILAHYRCDETAGTAVDNAEGTETRDATASKDLVNITTTDAKRGTAFNIDEDGESLTVSSAELMSDWLKGTIEFWYKPAYKFADSQGGSKYLFGSDTSGTANAIWVRVYDDGTEATLEFGVKGATLESSTTITETQDPLWEADEWVHLRFVWDDTAADVCKIYYNGRYITQTHTNADCAMGALAKDLVLGTCVDEGLVDHILDEIYIYNDAILPYGAFHSDFANSFAHPHPDLTFYDGMDSTTDGADYTVGVDSRIQSATTVVSGINGSGIQFNAAGDYQMFSTTSNLKETVGSLGMWVKSSSPDNPVADEYLLYGGGGFNLYYNSSGMLTFKFGAAQSVQDTADTYDGKWHWVKIAWDYNNDTYVLYVDGIAKGIDTTALSPSGIGSNFYIGNSSSTNANFNGIIDELYITSSSFSPEVQTAFGKPVKQPQLETDAGLKAVVTDYNCANSLSASTYTIQYLSDITTEENFTIADDPAATTGSYALTDPTDIIAGGARAPYTVTRYDLDGEPRISGVETVYLYTTSGSANARFYDAVTGGIDITDTGIVIREGQSSANFWYYDDEAGDQTITASDNPTEYDGDIGADDVSDVLTVKANIHTGFEVSGLPETIPVGTPSDVTVRAVDTHGNTNYDYTGEIHFTSSDTEAELPVELPETYWFVAPETYTQSSEIDFRAGEPFQTTVSVSGEEAGVKLGSYGTWEGAVPAVVYSPGDAGSWTSLAVDSQGNLHIAYRDGSASGIRYSTNASGDWVDTLIYSGGDIQYPSIAIDSNDKVHISFCHDYYWPGKVYHSTNASGGWVTTLVVQIYSHRPRYSSIAIDSNDKTHIAYYDVDQSDLEYVTNVSGEWVNTILDSSGRVGEYPSIAIDSNDKVHISYRDRTNYDLKYATNTSGDWVTTSIDTGGDVGQWTSLVLDSNDKLHISYFDESNDDLKYATNASGSWVATAMDSPGDLGRYGTSIVLDSDDKVYICYFDNSNRDLKYLTNASGLWEGAVIDSTGDVGKYASIAVDSNHIVHTSYYDDDNNDLKCASQKIIYYPSGMFTSSEKDLGQVCWLSAISWDADTPEGTSVKFQVASKPQDGEWTEFLGPGAAVDSYYTTPGQAISSAHRNHRYVKYRAYLERLPETSDTPILKGVTISYQYEGLAGIGKVTFPAAEGRGVTLKTKGEQTVTVTDTQNSDLTGSQSVEVEVTYLDFSRYSITTSSTQTAGLGWSETLRAVDSYGNTISDYPDTVMTLSNTGKAKFYTDQTETTETAVHTLSGGQGKIYIKDIYAETITITATDGTNSVTSGPITINPTSEPMVTLEVNDIDDPFVAGTQSDVVVYAKDANGYITNDYKGKVHFTSSDPKALLPEDFWFVTPVTEALDVSAQGKVTLQGTAGWSDPVVLASVGDGHIYPSLAFDSNNHAHICYYNNDGTIRYATDASGTWQFVKIGSCSGGIPSLAVDNNNKVHISYYYNYGLIYTTNVSGSWRNIGLGGGYYDRRGEHSSIVVDSNNKVHIAIYRAHDDHNLEYASTITGGWTLTTLDSIGNVGAYPSIAIDSNNKLHISYYDSTDGNLKYITNASGSWQSVSVDITGTVGQWTSIALDSNDKVHISYFDNSNDDLKYATNASGNWVTTSIDTAGNKGYYTSIALDSNDKVHISYFNEDNDDLKYATNASGSWKTSTLDSPGDMGRYGTSIAVDSNDMVHIAYFDNTNNKLKYIRQGTIYPASGSYVSEVKDLGQDCSFTRISWDADTPAGTSVKLQVATSADNVEWTEFSGQAAAQAGLVGLWHFDTDNNTDTTVVDSSGNSYTGTIDGATWSSNGKLGTATYNALSFNGDDYVNVEDASSLRLGKNMTVAAWVKVNANASDWVRLVGKGNSTYRNYGLWLNKSGTVLFQVFSAGGNGGVQTTETVNDGNWHHVAGTYDGSNLKVYIDGKLLKTGAYSQIPHTSSHPLTIGYATFHTYLNGLLDEVAVYNRALSASEILQYSGYYTVSGASIPSFHDGHRYIKYKAILESTDDLVAPTLNDVRVSYQYEGLAGAGAMVFSAAKGEGVILRTVGEQSVTATDTQDSNITGTKDEITVTGLGLNHYEITTSTPQNVGEGWPETIRVSDAYGNTVTSYPDTTLTLTNTGWAKFYTDESCAPEKETTTYTMSSGTVKIYVKDTEAETITVNATDGTRSVASGSIVVDPSTEPVVYLEVKGIPDSVVAGTASSVTVSAKDANGNTTSDYSGKIHFTSSDTQRILPEDYWFVVPQQWTETSDADFDGVRKQTVVAGTGDEAVLTSGVAPGWVRNSSWDTADIGYRATPAFADLNNDGKYDLIIGRDGGNCYAYRNTGSQTSPVWTRNSSWDVPDIGSWATPAFADLDNDGKYDLLVGEYYGKSYAYRNTGSQTSPVWTRNSSWDVPDIGYRAAPAIVDLDNDGKYDLMVGEDYGRCFGYRNTGSQTSPVWTRNSSWDIPDIGSNTSPAFTDLDNDGKYDLLVGESGGRCYAYKNTGSQTSPVWTRDSSWDMPDIGSRAAPAFADLNNDGDDDLLIGEYYGKCYGYRTPKYFSSGTYTSQMEDLGQGCWFSGISWNAYKPGGTSLKLQIASSSDNVNWTEFLGPDGVSNSGLVGVWHMDNSWEDGSENKNCGVAYNGATFTASAKLGSHAGSFNGDNSYVDIPNNSSLENVQEGNYTLEAWYRPRIVPPGTGSDNNAYQGIVMKTGWHIGLRYGYDKRFVMVHLLTGDVWEGATTSNTFNPGLFYHVVGVVDKSAGTTKIYVNGNLEGTNTFTPGTAAREYGTTPWHIGIGNPGASTYRWPADGAIDEVAIYARALTDPEILQHYKNGVRPVYTTSGKDISLVHNNHQYIKYKAILESDNVTPPQLRDVTIRYQNSSCPGAGTVVFSAAKDNGVTLKTMGTQWVKAEDTEDGNISGMQSDITVTHSSIDYYTVTAQTMPNPTAGVTWSETVTAYDGYGNKAVTASLPVTMSNKGSAKFYTDITGTTEQAANTYNLVNGEVTIYVKDTVAENINITATDTNGKTGRSNTITVNPAVPDHITLTGASTVTAGEVSGAIVITSYDEFNNESNVTQDTVFDLTSIPAAGEEGTPKFYRDAGGADVDEILNSTIPAAESTATFYYKNTLAKTYTLRANRTSGDSLGLALHSITVDPAQVNYYTITTNTPQVVGEEWTETIKAYDQFTNLATNATKPVTIISSTGNVKFYKDESYEATTIIYSFTEGVAKAYIKDNVVEEVFLTIEDKDDITASTGYISVEAGDISYYEVTTHTPQTIGVGWQETVTAKDKYGNTVASAAVAIAPSSNGDAQFYTNDSYDTIAVFYNLSGGTATVFAKDATPEIITISVTDYDYSGASSPIVVGSGEEVVSLKVEGIPSSINAGTPSDITVTALDASNNITANYTGKIQFSSTDAQAVLPENYWFVVPEEWRQSSDTEFKSGASGPALGTQVRGTGEAAELSLYSVAIPTTKNVIDGEFVGAIDVYAADVDSDGDMDVLGAAREADDIAWWENDGAQNFTKHIIDGGFDGAHSVYAVDVDSDGDMDVLGAAANTDDIAWWENDGLQNFTKHVIDGNFNYACSVYAIDVDSDGDMDVLGAAVYDHDIAWYENDGEQNFTKHFVDSYFYYVRDVYAIDVDKDGDIDVLGVSEGWDDIAWYENDGNQSFTKHNIDTYFDCGYSIYATDVDRDGDIDVLGAALYHDAIAWWENNGAQSFTKHTIDGGFDGAIDVYATDIDGDGDIDVLGSAAYADDVAWYENDGMQSFTKHVIDGGFDHTWGIYAADIDSDGDTDILGSAYYARDIAWWESKTLYSTSGTFTSSIKNLEQPAWFSGISWNADVPEDTSIKFLIASSTLPDTGWTEFVGPGEGDAQTDLIPGLVGLWHFNEGSGMSAQDSSPSNNTGTLVNTPVWIAGKFGRALNFDGTSDYVNISPINMNGDRTMAAWVKFPLPTTAQGWRTLFQRQGGTYHHIIWDSSGNIGCYNNSWSSSGYNTNSLSAGWHHIAAISSGGTTKFYIDGNYVSTANTQITQDLSRIGNHTDSQNVGSVDEVAIFNRAVTPDEIEDLAAGEVGTDVSGLYYTISGQDISSVHNNHKYIKYQAIMTSADNTITPTLKDVTIHYQTADCLGAGYVTFSVSKGNGVILKTVGEQSVTVEDPENEISGLHNPDPITVGPSSVIKRYEVTCDTDQDAGTGWEVTVTAYDPYGNIVTTDSETEVIMSNEDNEGNEGNAQFYIDESYLQLKTPARYGLIDGVATVYVKNNVAETITIIAKDDNGVRGYSDPITTKPGPAAIIELSGPAAVVVDEVSGAFIITAQDIVSNDTLVENDELFELSSDSQGEELFYLDAGGMVEATTVTMYAGTGTATFYYKDTKVASPSVTAKWISGGDEDLGYDSYSIAVTPADAAQLQITSDALNQAAGVQGAITVEVQDIHGNPQSDGSFTVNLASNSQAVDPQEYHFYQTGTQTATTSITIPAGTSSVAVDYYDEKAGNPTITVTDAAGNLDPYEQAQTIIPADAEKLVITTDPLSLEAGLPGTMNVEIQDGFGNPQPQGIYLVVPAREYPLPDFNYFYEEGTTTPMNSKTALNGESYVRFDYYDEEPGTPKVIVQAAGLTSDEQVHTIIPATASRLRIISSAFTLTAGTQGTITVEVQDTFGSPQSEGFVEVNLSSDSQATPPEQEYHFYQTGTQTELADSSIAIPDGVSSVTVDYYDEKAGSPAITVTDAAGDLDSHEQAQTVIPADAEKLVITNPALTLNAGEPGTMSVQVQDRFDNPQALGLYTIELETSSNGIFYNTGTTSPPGGLGMINIDSGVDTVSFDYYDDDPGTPLITVSDTAVPGLTSDTQTETIVPAPASYLIVTGNSSMAAGSENELTIRAYDVLDNLVDSGPNNYTDEKQLTFSGPNPAPAAVPEVEGVPLGTPTPIMFSNGVSVAGGATLIAYKAEITTVDVSDGTVNSFASEDRDLDLEVIAGVAVDVRITGPETIDAGVISGPFYIIAQDPGTNDATVSSETAFILDSDSGSDEKMFYRDPFGMNPTIQIEILVGESQSAPFYYSDTEASDLKPEKTTITAIRSSGDSLEAGSYTFTVKPDDAVKLQISDLSQSITAGAPNDITVTLYDQHDNRASGYSGTVRFECSDAKATLPLNYTFVMADAGSHTFSGGITFRTTTTDSQHRVTVVDTEQPMLTDTQEDISVTAAPAEYFRFTGGDNTMRATETNELQVTAYDEFHNVATVYEGPKALTFTSGPANSPSGAIPTIKGVEFVDGSASVGSVNFTQGVSDAGALTLVCYNVEDVSLEVTQGVVTTIGDETRNIDISVSSGLTDSFALLTSPEDIDYIVAGTSVKYTLTRYDAYLNPQTIDEDRVYLYTTSDGTAASFKDTEGNVVTTRSIQNGSSTVDFWYYDEKTSREEPGYWTITVSDAVPADGDDGIDDASDDITVMPAVENYFGITADTSTMKAGDTKTITITTYDQYNNVVTDYEGDKTLKFNGPGSSPDDQEIPPTAENNTQVQVPFNQGTILTFVRGVTTTIIRLYKAETTSVQAEEGVVKTRSTTDLDVVVYGGVGSKLSWDADNLPKSITAVNAIWAPFVIKVSDAYGNLSSASDEVTVEPSAGSFGADATTKVTAVNGLARFSNITYPEATASLTIVGSSVGLDSTVPSGNIVVESGYSVTWEARDSVFGNPLIEIKLEIIQGKIKLDTIERQGEEPFELFLPYGKYTFNFVKDAYVPTQIEKLVGVSADGVDGKYDNKISWTIFVMSVAESLADYRVLSDFAYDERSDTLTATMRLEKRGQQIVTSDINALGLATVLIYDGDTLIGTLTDPEADEQGNYWYRVENVVEGIDGLPPQGLNQMLVSGKTYFARCSIGYGGTSGDKVTYYSGTTFTITVTEKLKEVTDKIEEVSDEIKEEVIGVREHVTAESEVTRETIRQEEEVTREVVEEEAEEVKSTVVSKAEEIKVDTAEILTATTETLPSFITETVVSGVQPHIKSGILNRETTVRSGGSLAVRYRTKTGLVPSIDVYDAMNKAVVSKGIMKETTPGSGIYEFDVEFLTQWGIGDFSIICAEETLGTTDAMVITASEYDIADVASTTAAILGTTSRLSEFAQAAEGIESQINMIESALAQIINLEKGVGVDEDISEMEEAIEYIFTQLSHISKQIKALGATEDIDLEKVYEVSKEKKEDMTYLKNKTEELKATMDLSKKMIENVANKPVTQVWFEFR